MATFGDYFVSCIFSEPCAACFRPASEIRTKATPCTCGRMADIQSATAEIRRGGKKKKKEETTGHKYNGLPYSIGRPIKCWQLTCQFPTWQSPAWNSSNRHKWLKTNHPLHESLISLSSVRVHFAANAVPKLVAMATSLRSSISAMSSLDSLSPKTHPYN